MAAPTPSTNLRAQVDAALKAKYTPAQIVEYLAADPQVKAALDAQYTPDEIIQHLVQQSPAAPAKSTGRAVLDAVTDVPAGVSAATLRTVFGGGDIIRKTFGMERVIDRPEVQAAMTPPSSLSGILGYAAGTALLGSRMMPSGMGLGSAGAIGGGAMAGLQSGGDPTMTAIGAGTGALGNMLVTPLVNIGRATWNAGPALKEAWGKVGQSVVHGRPGEAWMRLLGVNKAAGEQLAGVPAAPMMTAFQKRQIEIQASAKAVADSIAGKFTREQVAAMRPAVWNQLATQHGAKVAVPRELVADMLPAPPSAPAPRPLNLGYSPGSPAATGAVPREVVPREVLRQSVGLPLPAPPSAPAPTVPAPTPRQIPVPKHADKPAIAVPTPPGTTGATVNVKGVSGAQLDAQQDALVAKVLDTIRRTREVRPELGINADELALAGKDQWQMLARAARTNVPSEAAQKRIIEALRAETADYTGLLKESIKRVTKKK